MICRLALSTSSKQGSLAIFNGTDIVYEKAWLKKNSHAEYTSLYIEEALQKLDLNISDIEEFICDIGPGSFTGVRIACATIKTLAYTTNKKILPVYSNDLLAASLASKKQNVLTVINALRNHFYACFYKSDAAAKKPALMSISDIENQIKQNTLLIGDGTELFLKHCSKKKRALLFCSSYLENPYPNIKWSQDIGLIKKELNETIEWNFLEPLYIRGSSAEEKLQLGELKGAKYYTRRKPR